MNRFVHSKCFFALNIKFDNYSVVVQVKESLLKTNLKKKERKKVFFPTDKPHFFQRSDPKHTYFVCLRASEEDRVVRKLIKHLLPPPSRSALGVLMSTATLAALLVGVLV